MIKSLVRSSIAVVLLLAALGWSGGPLTPARAAAETVSTCDMSHFVDAIEAAAPGATVTFSCSGTIHLTGAIILTQDVTIDGGGQVTIDGSEGGSGETVFTIGYLGEPTPPNVTLRNLSIVNGDSFLGGVVENYGRLTVYNTTFTGNQSEANCSQGGGIANCIQGGGGIENYMGTLTVIHCTFSNNKATYAQGGGINNISGTVTVIDSTFSGNSAGVFGGGIANAAFTSSATLTIIGSTFSGNSAGINSNPYAGVSGAGVGGGGIMSDGTLTVVNSTFSGNTASSSQGGGMLTGRGTTTITNSTFSGNSADFGGSTIEYDPGGKMSLRGTILAYPQSHRPNIVSCAGKGLIDLGGSVEDGTTCGFGKSSRSNTDPLLGALANNGGLTRTIALKSGSPAIGIASCSAGSPLYGIDQRGYIRPTSHCDAGAYDHSATQPFSTIAVSVVGNAAGTVVLSARVDSSGPPVVVTTTTNGVTTVSTVLSAYPAHGQIFPTGTVTFHDGSATGPVIACAEGDSVTHAVALPGTAAPESATCSTGSLAAGAHSIIAVYSGDGTFRGVANRYGPATFTVG